MDKFSRKERIENVLNKSFAPQTLVVRDDSKHHQGHMQVDAGSEETHFYVKMTLDFPKGDTKITLHRKVYKLLEKEFAGGLHALELKLTKN